jgi:hypothetical protein
LWSAETEVSFATSAEVDGHSFKREAGRASKRRSKTNIYKVRLSWTEAGREAGSQQQTKHSRTIYCAANSEGGFTSASQPFSINH